MFKSVGIHHLLCQRIGVTIVDVTEHRQTRQLDGAGLQTTMERSSGSFPRRRSHADACQPNNAVGRNHNFASTLCTKQGVVHHYGSNFDVLMCIRARREGNRRRERYRENGQQYRLGNHLLHKTPKTHSKSTIVFLFPCSM